MGEILYSIEEFAPDRDKVSVFGKEYEILSYDDFGLKENAEIQREGKKITEAMPKLLNLDEKQLTELDQRLDRFIGKIIKDLPQGEITKLTYNQKGGLLNAFLKSAEGRKAKAETEKQKKEKDQGQQIGETS